MLQMFSVTRLPKSYLGILPQVGLQSALDDKKIDMPYDTYQHLVHDRTENVDGDRNAQREGWTTDLDDNKEPKWKAQIKQNKQSVERNDASG